MPPHTHTHTHTHTRDIFVLGVSEGGWGRVPIGRRVLVVVGACKEHIFLESFSLECFCCFVYKTTCEGFRKYKIKVVVLVR